MELLIRRSFESGLNPIRRANVEAGELIDFSLLFLETGNSCSGSSEDRELLLVLLSGTCTVRCGRETFESIGLRRDVFSGRPYSVFVPPGTLFEIEAQSKLEAAVLGAPSTAEGQPELIPPEQVKGRSVGRWNWRRDVYDIVGHGGCTQRLIVGETINAPGAWSSYPPHKHDIQRPPLEVKLEEIYHYRCHPAGGFGFQRIYTSDGEIDEVYTVKDRDTVVIPRGYHPVVAAPGYSLYYLWVLSGDTQLMQPYDDPAHAWVKGVETLIDEMGR